MMLPNLDEVRNTFHLLTINPSSLRDIKIQRCFLEEIIGSWYDRHPFNVLIKEINLKQFLRMSKGMKMYF
jgi:hypothetical protein